jgi:putative endonuclease
VSRGASGRPQPDGAADQPRAAGGDSERAALWYEDHGYEVLERNWSRREGEVDLIVRRGATVVFSEVVTPTNGAPGTGVETVLPATQRRTRRLASRWLSELTPAGVRARIEFRFDVVSIVAGTVEVIEDAF